MAAYGFVLLMAGFAYFLLTLALIAQHGKESIIAKALGRDFKGKISIVIYAIAIPIALYLPWFSFGLYVLVAGVWLVPDRRIEKSTHS